MTLRDIIDCDMTSAIYLMSHGFGIANSYVSINAPNGSVSTGTGNRVLGLFLAQQNIVRAHARMFVSSSYFYLAPRLCRFHSG